MTQEEESALMFVKLDIVEAPDLGAPDGGCVSGGGMAGDSGPGPATACVSNSAPHRGAGQESSSGVEIEKKIPSGKLEQSTISELGGAVRVVHLMEEHVYVVLGDEGDKEPCQWVLDTGASNHMSGAWAAFSGINGRTIGTVRFTDGSVVFIEGVGTMVYEGKNEEHRTLTDVYYIPRLQTSIISIGQLDECRYEIGIRGGVLSLRDENQRLLARIQ
jgi:hypothetical protein